MPSTEEELGKGGKLKKGEGKLIFIDTYAPVALGSRLRPEARVVSALPI